MLRNLRDVYIEFFLPVSTCDDSSRFLGKQEQKMGENGDQKRLNLTPERRENVFFFFFFFF